MIEVERELLFTIMNFSHPENFAKGKNEEGVSKTRLLRLKYKFTVAMSNDSDRPKWY